VEQEFNPKDCSWFGFAFFSAPARTTQRNHAKRHEQNHFNSSVSWIVLAEEGTKRMPSQKDAARYARTASVVDRQ
jgi:hypothetical protein